MKEPYGFIYLTIDLKNGKGYVGQHKISNQKTLDPQYIGTGKIIKYILKGNGNDKSRFHRQILCFCESREELDDKEKEYIVYFDAIESENFYNFAKGGEGGDTFSNKSDEEKELIRKKQSEIKKGKKKSEETRKKMSIAQKGIKMSEEAKKKSSISHKGNKNSKETRKKISLKNKGHMGHNNKSCYCIELNICFDSCRTADYYCRNILKVRTHGSGFACNNKCDFAGKLKDGTKLTWKYATNVDQYILDKAIKIDRTKYEEEYNKLLSKN